MNGLPDPIPEAALGNAVASQELIKEHSIVVITETRTNEIDRLMSGLHGMHRLIHATHITPEHAGHAWGGCSCCSSVC